MSADRYEITDDGALTISIKLGENTQYVDELEDDFVVGAIRQQARDIAELEVFAEIGRQWNTDSSLAKWFPLTAERIGQDAQEIAALTAERDQLLCANCNQGRQRNGGICPHQRKEYEGA